MIPITALYLRDIVPADIFELRKNEKNRSMSCNDGFVILKAAANITGNRLLCQSKGRFSVPRSM
jgi:hypothetical protein